MTTSPNKRLLVQWIGHSDLRAMAIASGEARQQEIYRKIGADATPRIGSGPTKTLLDTVAFDEVRLLSNYSARWNTWYMEWLDRDVELSRVELANPTDYRGIFRICDAELAKIKQRSDWGQTELCLHLSPGTPAMAAIWLLLGKTRYPATIYETYEHQSWITDVPLDITIDVLPDILRDPDRYLSRLSAERPRDVEGFSDIAGESVAIREAVGRAKRAAMRSVCVLLLGESGTGKEMFAQAIHRASPRRSARFLAINCAALSKGILESELFGHVRGAFTGADEDRRGAFELADGGTVFLDEITECDLDVQAKLLRVLQPVAGQASAVRTIRRLGDHRDRQVDVRIVAATNTDVFKAIREERFREDLYYRLATVSITLPPLRERRNDIDPITDSLMRQINSQFARDEPNYTPKSLSEDARMFLRRHTWPGNVRQLYNTLVQAAVLSESDLLCRTDLIGSVGELHHESPSPREGEHPLGDGFDLEEHLNQLRVAYLRRAMQQANGVKADAARLLGMPHYQTLSQQLQRLNVDWKDRG